CLRFIESPDSLLLIENGVYGALQKNPCFDALQSLSKTTLIYALEPDVLARGVREKLLPYVKQISYADFVALSASHHAVQSWL
ncbi:MAG: sulfurtransferase complex subunit TusB, partial [Gammaproteobacteria bacterium]|nr:sulfurtransferase complex subunit TusB [Gammaproteobacteria bacterium]